MAHGDEAGIGIELELDAAACALGGVFLRHGSGLLRDLTSLVSFGRSLPNRVARSNFASEPNRVKIPVTCGPRS
jgi:hypothetical protein